MKTPFNVLRHVNQWEMAPRDPVTVGSLLLTGGTAAGLAATGLAAFGYAAVGYLATTAITSWALNALAPDIGGIGGSRGLMVNATDPAAPHDIVYGTVRKGGIRTYVEATGDANKYLHMILVLAGHELAGIDDIYLNDEIVTVNATSGFVTSGSWNSKIRIKKHRGNEIVADSLLVGESNQVDSTFVGNGIAYLYIRLQYDQDVFANGIPLVTAMVRGRKVYDPRTTSTAYTANASLAVRDYITAGFGLADSAVDDPAFAASANVSDEAISLAGGGTEPRYEINGVVSSDMSPRTIVSRMMSSCGGTLFWGQGKFQLHVGYYSNPVKTLTLNDLRGSISVDTRVGARDNFNRVVGTFADKEVGYITVDFPPIESAAFKTEDNGIENTLDFQLPLTTSESAAQRLAKMTLFRAREQMTLSAEFGLEAFSVQVGDVLAFANERYGWTAKEFEVVGWRFETSGDGGDLRVNLTLRETSEAAFAWNAEEIEIIHNNTLLLPYTSAPNVGIGVVADLQISNEKVSNIAVVTVTSAGASQVSFVEVEYKNALDSNYTSIGQGPIGDFRVRDLAVGFYDFRARSVNAFGYRGQFEYLGGVEIDPFTGVPDDVSSLEHEISSGTLFLTWAASLDFDLSFYRVKHNSQTTGATWSNSSVVIEKVARPSTNATLPARSGTFLIRAYDKEGNFSENFTSVVVQPSELPPLGAIVTQTENPTFSGAKTNVILAAGAIEISNTTANAPIGEYFFSAYVDTGSNRDARVTGVRTFERRYDNGTLLWDAIPQQWDTWAGNWDTWTNEDAEFGDVSVAVYTSATPDDPAGSPTWGAYVLANGAEVQGRAFRFKAVLTSTNKSFTPAITALSVTVEY
tara:strand:+ start:801 stop:3380 length:2580 start_codon:yes stop_codon:yes gene_type:complete